MATKYNGDTTALITIPKSSDYMTAEEFDYWKARKNRMFFIDYTIDDNYLLVELGKTILTMNMRERNVPKDKLKPIYLFIYSYGGDLYQAWSLISIIQASRIPIITINMGVAMSAGFLLLLSGHKRYGFKYASAMVHHGSAATEGNSNEFLAASKNYEKMLGVMDKYVLKNTSIPDTLYKKHKKEDWYLSPAQQLKFGVVDKLIDSIDEVFDNTPKSPKKKSFNRTKKSDPHAPKDRKFDSSKAIEKVETKENTDKDESE